MSYFLSAQLVIFIRKIRKIFKRCQFLENCAQQLRCTPKFLTAFLVNKFSISEWQTFIHIYGLVKPKAPIKNWAFGTRVGGNLQVIDLFGKDMLAWKTGEPKRQMDKFRSLLFAILKNIVTYTDFSSSSTSPCIRFPWGKCWQALLEWLGSYISRYA